MPNRIIKESICTSENIDQLTEFQETFFYRLMVNCDDYGRFDARPKILSARLYPLRRVPAEVVEEALEALEAADLITVYEVDGHVFLQMNTWGKHQQTRASKSKYPAPDEAQMQANDSNGYQMISDDIKCPRNRNRNTLIDNRESISISGDGLIDDDEAREIQVEQNRVLDAAEDAGFKMGNSVRASLIRLYSEHGLQKVLDGIGSCVKHGAPNLAYLEACMKGKPKQAPVRVSAQDFEQRDYSDVNGEMMTSLARGMAEFKRTGEVS